MVPNISSTNGEDLIKVHSPLSSRRGRTIYIKPLKTGRYANLRFNSLPFNGARLFNSLPKFLRNQINCNKDCFKSRLDIFLKQIPDQPLLRSNYYSRQTQSNSILNMALQSNTCPDGTRWEESAQIGRQ